MIKKTLFTFLALAVALSPGFAATTAEDKPGETNGKGEIKKSRAAERQEETEEDTMLDIMPYLKLPKKTSIKYSIAQQFEYQDNYYLTKNDKNSRFASYLSPAIALKYPMGRTYLEGDYAYSAMYYIGKKNLFNHHDANVKLYHRPTRRFSVGLSERFLRSDRAGQQRDIDVKVPGRAFDKNNLTWQAKYEINKRWRCGAGGNFNFLYFNQTPTDATPSNTQFMFGGNMDYVIDQRSRTGVSYDFSDILFRKSGEKDLSNHAVGLRYLRKVRKTFTVDAHGNYTFITSEKGTNITGATAGADLNFNISRFTRFTLGYDYGLKHSSRTDYLLYRTHGFQAIFNHKLIPRLAVGVNSSYDMMFYDPDYAVSSFNATSDRKSQTIRFTCNVDYKLTKKIDISACYSTNAKFSDFGHDSFFANHYFLSIKATF